MVKYSDICEGNGGERAELGPAGLRRERVPGEMGGLDQGYGRAGQQGANLLLGALSQYYRVDFEVYPMASGATLRLLKGNTGMAGGLLGMSKVNKQFVQLSDTLASWFNQQGVLEGVKKE